MSEDNKCNCAFLKILFKDGVGPQLGWIIICSLLRAEVQFEIMDQHASLYTRSAFSSCKCHWCHNTTAQHELIHQMLQTKFLFSLFFTVPVFRVHHCSIPQLRQPDNFQQLPDTKLNVSKKVTSCLFLGPDKSRTYNTLHKWISGVVKKHYKKDRLKLHSSSAL